jgi:hypothetical protein
MVRQAWTEHYAEALGHTRSFIVRLGPDGTEKWRLPFGPHAGTTYASAIVPLGGGRLIAVGSTGPELIDEYGGDDLDVLAVLYQE